MPAPTTQHRRSALAAASVVAVLVVVLWSGTSAPAGASAPLVSTSPTAVAGAAWLEGQVTAGGGELSNGAVDWGLTADAAIALVAVNGPTDPAALVAVTNLLAHIESYTTFADAGPDFAGVELAGPIAKSLLAAEVTGQGSDPVAVTLQTELRSLVGATGRFSDLNPYGADVSNGFGQADAILALARTAGGVPTSAVDFLLGQQCPNGGFRLVYSAGACTDNTQADTDATGMAVQALLAVDRTPAVATALSAAVGWLESIQDPATGSFSGTGPTDTANTNSAGLIAEALRGAGATTQADRAAAFVTSLQLVPPAVDAGAIAYDPDGFAAATSGIPTLSLDQWHRATSQAVLALGVAPLGSIGAGGAPWPELVDASAPPSTSSTTTSTGPTTTTTTPPATTTVPSGGSTVPTAAAATASTVPVQVLGDSVQQVNFADALGSTSTTGTTTATTSGNLAFTGSEIEPLVALGVMALLLGLAAAFAVRFGDWPA